MGKTQSINKAKNGSVSVVIDGKTYFIEPKDIEIYPDVTLENSIDKVSDKHKGYDLIVKVLNEKISKLVSEVENLKELIKVQKQELQSIKYNQLD